MAGAGAAAVTTDGAPAGWLARHAQSIRTRIVVGYIVLIVATFGVAIVVLRQLLITRVDRDTQTMMASEATALAQLADTDDPATGQPYGLDVRTLFETFLRTRVPAGDEYFVTFIGDRLHQFSLGSPIDGNDASTFAEGWIGRDTPLRTSVTTDGERVEVLAVPVSVDGVTEGTFVVLRTPGNALDDVDRVVRTLSLVGLGVSLIGLLAAWIVAGRVLRPIDELTTTARAISDRDLSARIPVSGADELAELGRTFNAMMDRVERGAVRQRQFVDDVAHELRTPITVVSGHLELMGDDPVERAETVAIAEDELARMSRYVNDLLALAKAELPEFVRFGPVDVGEVIASLHGRLAAIAPRRWVVDQTPPIGALVIDADQDRLVQAMVNLATNAAEHTAPGDEIGIGAGDDGVRAELWVRDTGPGVDPAVRDSLFDRSQRGAVSRARRPEGAGIGLSIVAAIADAHGGEVRIDPTWTSGARFVITVPVQRPQGDTP